MSDQRTGWGASSPHTFKQLEVNHREVAEIFEQSETRVNLLEALMEQPQHLWESIICRAQNPEVTDENKSFERRVKELQVTDEESSQTKALEDNIKLARCFCLIVCFYFYQAFKITFMCLPARRMIRSGLEMIVAFFWVLQVIFYTWLMLTLTEMGHFGHFKQKTYFHWVFPATLWWGQVCAGCM